MKKVNFDEALEKILGADSRYDAQAYLFLREALDFTVRLLAKPQEGPSRHVSGAELLEGIRQFALQEFGPMAKTVLNRWGVTRCEDFGELVFNLVQNGVLGKTEQDRKEDFAGGYDFDEAFQRPFLPHSRAGGERRPARKKNE
jgi:uncharacterized repeat protein (TIGR04138 family)